MDEPLKLLLIEDSDDDAMLVIRYLRRGGFQPVYDRIQTAEEMRLALALQVWDVIIADYQLPSFSAPAALGLLQESGRNIPFIIVSGTIGEQAAVTMMRNGAGDYVMKDNLERLPEAVRREIREARVRTERKRAEAALQSLIEGTAAFTGVDFFKALVRQIAISLDVSIVVVSELEGEQLRSLAFWAEGRLQPDFAYAYTNSPCAIVLDEKRCVVPISARRTFPQFTFFADWQIESYMGVLLADANGAPIGNLCVMDTGMLKGPERTETLLRVFATRAASELERQRATRALERVNRELETIVAQRTAELRRSNEQLATTNLELARATRLKDEFLANMSHELRTPLNAILGLSESLQEHIYGALNERQQRTVATIERSGRHLLALINDILDLSKIASGKLVLKPEPTIVCVLCEHSMLFVAEQAMHKRITLTSTIPDELRTLKLLADELRIRQALINLLANAVKFTPEGGKVSLEVELVNHLGAGQRLRFHVVDTGIGIAEEDIGQLFQPFVQVDNSLSRRQSGTGLGLALVKQIAELHNGSVGVTSQPGAGSRFTLEIPYTAIEEAEARPQHPAPAGPCHEQSATNTGQLILLAEDHEANRGMVSAYLENQGFRMLHATTGVMALAQAHTHRPDLILMDVRMPELDGFEAIEQIRADADLAHIPIIALTAFAMSSDEARCLSAGANGYMSKPVRLRELLALIRKLLQPAPQVAD